MGDASAIAATGLAAAAVGVSTAAANVANALTPGYQPARVEQAAQPEGGVTARVVHPGDPLGAVRADRALLGAQGLDVGVDLVEETLAQTRSARLFEANLKSLQTATDLEGELLKALR